jgi:hypothetical protein
MSEDKLLIYGLGGLMMGYVVAAAAIMLTQTQAVGGVDCLWDQLLDLRLLVVLLLHGRATRQQDPRCGLPGFHVEPLS